MELKFIVEALLVAAQKPMTPRELRELLSAAVAYATLSLWIYGLVAVPFAIYALWSLPRSTPATALWMCREVMR